MATQTTNITEVVMATGLFSGGGQTFVPRMMMF